jgi:glycerol-3-phosphate dehydrogenase
LTSEVVYDVAVIGGGINGTVAAQHLAAAGYSVVLLEKEDFGSGATSRSSRFAHCGLFYLKPEHSILDHVRRPWNFLHGFRTARRMMAARDELGLTNPSSVRPIRVAFPIERGGPFPPWQIDVAFRLLTAPKLNTRSLNYKRLRGDEARRHPFGVLCDANKLAGLALFDEYQFVWPERICIDAALDAERMGARMENYTAVTRIQRSDGRWRLQTNGASPAEICAHVVINAAGSSVDAVNALVGSLPRCSVLSKGAHILVKMPKDCAGLGFVTFGRDGEFFSVAPAGELHYIGPTHTPYDGDPDEARVCEADISHLLEEAAVALPGLRLGRGDVLGAWAGVRPFSYDSAHEVTIRDRVIREMPSAPNLFSVTWGRLVDHRDAAREIVALVRKKLSPSSAAKTMSLPTASSDIEAIASEHIQGLGDVMFRRTSLGWDPRTSAQTARDVASRLGRALQWDANRVEGEVSAYESHRKNVLGIKS